MGFLKKYKFLSLILISSVVLLFQLGSYYLFDKDEPRYPEAAREMIELHEYVIPKFNYENRYDKPILFYWLEIASIKSFGFNEFAARFPSALFSLGLLCLCYLLGSSAGVAFSSAIILLTSLEYFVISRMSITDMVLNFFISGSLIFFYLRYSNKLSKNWFYLCFIFSALGVLCKGPVAIVLPGLIAIIFLLLRKDLWNFIVEHKKEFLLGLLILLGITLPWYILVHIKTNGEFTESFFLTHNLGRYLDNAPNHKKGPFWFFIPVILVGFIPWSLFLFSSVKSALKNIFNKENSLKLFLITWSLVIFLFYSASSIKLINYILPVFLPLAVLVAIWIHKRRVFNILAITSIACYLVVVPTLLKPLSEKSQKASAEFLNSVPKDARLIMTSYDASPAVHFYAKRKVEYTDNETLKKLLESNEKIYFIIKKSFIDEIRDLEKDNFEIQAESKRFYYGLSR